MKLPANPGIEGNVACRALIWLRRYAPHQISNMQPLKHERARGGVGRRRASAPMEIQSKQTGVSRQKSRRAGMGRKSTRMEYTTFEKVSKPACRTPYTLAAEILRNLYTACRKIRRPLFAIKLKAG